MNDDKPVELPVVDLDPEDALDHPDDPIDDDEAEAGRQMYLAVDDLDDESNGLDR